VGDVLDSSGIGVGVALLASAAIADDSASDYAKAEGT
jgi:hypothetical protein